MTVVNRIALIGRLQGKSRSRLKESQLLLDEGFYDSAISRAYYAMFYLAQAMLATKDIYRKKHSAVISAFGYEFVRTGVVSKGFAANIKDAFDERLDADYSFEAGKTEEEAQKLLTVAEEFASEINAYLNTWIAENQQGAT